MFGKPKKKMSLESAILAGEIKEVRRSLESGTDPNQPISDERGGYPLHFAVNSSIEMMQLLIEHGADVNAKDQNGKTPLHITAVIPSIEKMQILIEHGADVNAVDANDKTPLNYALEGTPASSFFAGLGVSPNEEEMAQRRRAAEFLRVHGAK